MLMKLGFSRKIFGKYYFMNIRQAEAELFYMDKWTDGQTDSHDGGNGLFSQVCELT
jgi:hypothetical protein